MTGRGSDGDVSCRDSLLGQVSNPDRPTRSWQSEESFQWLVERLTFKIHSIHEHQHNIMRNVLQEVRDVTIGGVLYPLVDLLHRDQRDGPRAVPEETEDLRPAETSSSPVSVCV